MAIRQQLRQNIFWDRHAYVVFINSFFRSCRWVSCVLSVAGLFIGFSRLKVAENMVLSDDVPPGNQHELWESLVGSRLPSWTDADCTGHRAASVGFSPCSVDAPTSLASTILAPCGVLPWERLRPFHGFVHMAKSRIHPSVIAEIQPMRLRVKLFWVGPFWAASGRARNGQAVVVRLLHQMVKREDAGVSRRWVGKSCAGGMFGIDVSLGFQTMD